MTWKLPLLSGSENAGLLALTRVGSRRVVQISAGFMIFFSILGKLSYMRSLIMAILHQQFVIIITHVLIVAGKFGAVFASIPAPIIAALYCLFFAYVGTNFWFNSLTSGCKFLIDFTSRQWTIYAILPFICAGAGGLSFLQFCNLNPFRTKFILGFSIFLGLSVPQYFNEYTAVNGYGPVHTGGRWVRTKIIFVVFK